MFSSKTLWLWIFSLILSFTLGSFFDQKNNHSPSSSENEEEIVRKNFNYQYINPILECNPDIAQNNNLSSLKKSINQVIDQEIQSKNINFASVYFRDLNNGPWIGINEKTYFAPASLIKVPILITYFKKAEGQPALLEKKIPIIINSSGDLIQNIKPSVSFTPNQEYTIQELIEKMIIESDNDAYNTLSQNLSGEEFIKVYQDLDIDISKAFTDPNGNIITVKDYASFYRILFNASYLNQDMSEKALSILSQTKYKDALVAGVPKNISVAHKFGERKFLDTGETQFHDCGIVYMPKKPYLLCIMTRGGDIQKSSQVIKNISQKVYQSLSSN
ncbi:MAG: class A beta-lactamase-related serine hydrolase [Candidatus Shapirobacteria bacterium]|nr:class A beta-lactamase-related serine hydrolase [Candidatus Shapirobacteria bacterium]